jgi:cytochrome c oxidase cbb3-type subunit 3
MVLLLSPVWAAAPTGESILNNPLAIILLILMVLLLLVIGVLANILLGAAELKIKKKNIEMGAKVALLLLSTTLVGQGAVWAQNSVSKTTPPLVGGMNATAFYIMTAILFLELIVTITLLINVLFLIRPEKNRFSITSAGEISNNKKISLSAWWNKINLFRPINEETEIDLGHNYDGIRELDNRLPPWWLYGFYITIVFAAIYLYRFHISHSAPSSKEEFEIAIAKSEAEVKAYIKLKGESVDENTVTLLTSAEDLSAGQKIFLTPGKCVTCHAADGGGNEVGPNLVDDYWIYSGDIKTIFKTIKYGAKNGMKSWQDELSAKQIAQVSSYIKSLHGTTPKNPREPMGKLYVENGTK